MVNVKIKNGDGNDVTYNDIDTVTLPLASGSGTATFIDSTGDTATADDILSGKTAHIATGPVTGTIVTKTSSDLTASANIIIAPAGYYASDASKSIDITTVTENEGSIVSTTYTQGTVSVDTAGYITTGTKVNGATFANTGTASVTYKDISATTAAPVLISGDYLYINKGYTDDCKISLAKLAPDEGSAELASNHILSGYSAYNNDGQLIAGNIATYSGSIIIS